MDPVAEEVAGEAGVKVEVVKLAVVAVGRVYLVQVDEVVCPAEVVKLAGEDRWEWEWVEEVEEDLEVVVLLPMEVGVSREATSDPGLPVVYPLHRVIIGRELKSPAGYRVIEPDRIPRRLD